MANKQTPTPAITSNSTYTNYFEQEIAGFGQPGSTVYLYDNGSYSGQAAVGANGTWKDDVNLVTGSNSIVGYDYNSAGLQGTTNTHSTYVNPFASPSVIPPNVSIDPGVKFGAGTSATITGEVTGVNPVSGVYLYSDGSYIGSAAVDTTNGTWSYKFNQGAGDFANIQAVAYDSKFNASIADANYELITGITGEPYRNEQLAYSPDGSLTNANFYAKGGSLAYNAAYRYNSSGDTLGTLTRSGSNVTFSANLNDKRDEIVKFIVSGSSHDTLNVAGSNIHNMNQLLAHSSTTGGDTTIHLDSYSSIVLDGVTKAQIQSHPGDIKYV